MVKYIHSACPKKFDIHPGTFLLRHISHLDKGDLEEWECELCRTVMLVFKEKDEN